MTDHLFADAAATFGRLAALERQNKDLRTQLAALDEGESEGPWVAEPGSAGGGIVHDGNSHMWYRSLAAARAVCNALNRVAARGTA